MLFTEAEGSRELQMTACVALPIVAACLYPAIYFGYRQVLAQKRLELSSVVTDKLATLYRSVFGIPIDVLSKKSYSLRAYVLPVLINSLLGWGITALALARLGLPCLALDVRAIAQKTPPAIIATLAGAFLWGLYDALRRYRTVNLTPDSLHFMWLRVAIAGGVSPFVALTFQGGVAALVGFGLGAFPLSSISDFLQAQLTEKLNIKTRSAPTEGPTLQQLQGLTASTMDMLAEVGLESCDHLAYADPVKLFLRTNIPWKVILDLIDQALLFNYIGEKMAVLRPFGIRGAMELSDVHDYLVMPESESRGASLVKLIATAVGQQDDAVRNLIQTVEDDYQVRFIGELWGSAYAVD